MIVDKEKGLILLYGKKTIVRESIPYQTHLKYVIKANKQGFLSLFWLSNIQTEKNFK
jgi:hypothetical protein